MTNLWPVVRHALLFGGVLSAVLCLLLLGVLWINPEILLHDYPPDIRDRHGPMSARAKRHKGVATLVIGVVAILIVVASFASVRAGDRIPFLTAFVHLFVMGSVFNVADLLLDWLLVAIAPRFVVLPGTEGAAGYKDYRFHFRGFLIGAALIPVVSVPAAAVVAVVF